MPLTIILILFGASYLPRLKKRAALLRITAFVMLIAMSNQFLTNIVMRLWEPEAIDLQEMPTYDLAIVLTGVTNLNKSTPDRVFFNKGADRATQTIQLYKLGKINKILITGGQGLFTKNGNREAELLANFMEIAGVAKEDIIIENQAVNTRENAVFTAEILADEYPKEQKHLLITSAYHMYRAQACFDKVGLQTAAFPVAHNSHPIRFNIEELLFPDPMCLVKWQSLFKEIIGIATYKVMGYL